MDSRNDKACYKVLMESGALPKEQLDAALSEAQSSKLSIADIVIKRGLIKESVLFELYARSAGTSCVNIKSAEVSKDLIAKVPVKFAWYYKFFPVDIQNRKLRIAVARILDVHTIDEIRFGLGFEIETVFCPEADIEQQLKKHYGLGAETVDKIISQTPESQRPEAVSSMAEEKDLDIEKLAETASVVKLVNQIILEAYKRRASDIHIEPYRGKIRLRYRIDGRLEEAGVPAETNQFIMPILSRIKIMANLNIVERRLPQDGKARVKTEEQFLNLRVSSLPTPHGESLVVRILPTKMILSLDQLGFEADNLKIFRELLQRPYGIIFLTGPTGSGKSTTLYAGLKSLDTNERKIITLEDPIEYEIDDITQVQVIPEIGLTFARGLRSILRHDPDIMMVGEVRDLETADIAIRSALTGHLMLSTLHTNDASSGITRLLDIGVEPYLVASSVVAFVAQRLVRMICPHCREENKKLIPGIREIIQRDLWLGTKDEIKIYYGKGCDKCGGTGYAGRMALHEILPIQEEIRQQILTATTADEIKKKARQLGMITLRQDGWHKVLRGLTTPDEIVKATPADEPLSKMPPISETQAGSEKGGAKKPVWIPSEPAIMTRGENDEATDESDEVIGERRKYTRIRIQLQIVFRTISLEINTNESEDAAKNWKGLGETENVSAGGLAFKTAEPLAVGAVLELKINLGDGERPVECIGRALRVRPLEMTTPDGRTVYLVGVSFLAIHSNDRLRLEKFCKEHIEG